jgi:hypothetical protein
MSKIGLEIKELLYEDRSQIRWIALLVFSINCSCFYSSL